MTPSEIGTSMLSAPARSARQALTKNGRPAKAAAGNAISAEAQWKKSRVSGVMSLALPAHTETDSSMMFIAAKPATASAAQSAGASRLRPRSSARSGANG